MKPLQILIASLALSVATSGVASAQMSTTPMHSKSAMKMSADMNMMMSCKRMSKTAMMKNKRCSSMMKMHPDMMKMSSADMKKMSACMKMSDKRMMADKRCASMMKMHHAKMMAR